MKSPWWRLFYKIFLHVILFPSLHVHCCPRGSHYSGFLHPFYCSLALTVASTPVSREEAPQAVSEIMLGGHHGNGIWRTVNRGKTWLAIAAVILMASSTESVNSYIAEYLGSITHISGKTLSIVLFIYGLASLVGNVVGACRLSNFKQP